MAAISLLLAPAIELLNLSAEAAAEDRRASAEIVAEARAIFAHWEAALSSFDEQIAAHRKLAEERLARLPDAPVATPAQPSVPAQPETPLRMVKARIRGTATIIEVPEFMVSSGRNPDLERVDS